MTGLCVISLPVTGSALSVPIVVIAVLSIEAAVIDLRIQRIPNGVIVAGLVSVAVGILFAAFIEERPLGQLCVAAGLGVLLGGAPFMFLMWLIRPASVGGGDWKLSSGRRLTRASSTFIVLRPSTRRRQAGRRR